LPFDRSTLDCVPISGLMYSTGSVMLVTVWAWADMENVNRETTTKSFLIMMC